jgi:asparaginyl-tRNA synthetase
MIEPEVAFMDLEGDMQLAEAFLIHIVTTVLAHHRADLKVIGRDITKLEAVIAPAPATDSSLLSSRSAAEGSASGSATEQGVPGSTASPPTLGSGTEMGVILSEEKNPRIYSGASPTSAPTSRFPRLTYDEAHALLEDAFSRGLIEAPHIYGDDFGSPDETYISSQFSKPVMIHRYPAAIKAFYMQPDPADPTKALCVDVLAPEGYGEIIGGSQRVDSYDLLRARILEHGLPLSAFEWYLDLRRYGSVPHSGFGMGIERVVAWLCGLDHVRETIPFARTLNRIYP